MCDRQEHVWPDDVHNDFARAVEALLGHYGWLAKNALNRGVKRYSIVQKHHLAAHLPDQSQWLAPRCCWTYGSESFMGLCKKICASCVKGTPAASVSPKFMEKSVTLREPPPAHPKKADTRTKRSDHRELSSPPPPPRPRSWVLVWCPMRVFNRARAHCSPTVLGHGRHAGFR
eukprot:7764986-Pyramimonas_sp.AAC.1